MILSTSSTSESSYQRRAFVVIPQTSEQEIVGREGKSSFQALATRIKEGRLIRRWT
jgi:hypothetical protein